MSGILAIETATDACSVAVFCDDQMRQSHEVTPRQHSQRLFGMLRELLPNGNLREQGIETVAYGCGPGSFTGLRIAASAVQGLCYASNIPAVPVSTLACQAATAVRLGNYAEGDYIISILDARINEIYFALYQIRDERPQEVQEPKVVSPEDVQIPAITGALYAVGNGCALLDSFPVSLKEELLSTDASILPQARDLVPYALASLEQGRVQAPEDVQPVYVRDEINWKKLPQQGKRS